MKQNEKKKTYAFYAGPIFSLYIAGICSQVVLVEFTGFRRCFKQFYFKDTNIYTSHKLVLLQFEMLPYWASCLSRMSKTFTLLLCYCSSGISACLKCVIWAIKYVANAAVHCTSLTGQASYRFIIGIKIWLFCHTDIICVSSVSYFTLTAMSYFMNMHYACRQAFINKRFVPTHLSVSQGFH